MQKPVRITFEIPEYFARNVFSKRSAPKTLNKDLSSAIGQARSEKGHEERGCAEVSARRNFPVCTEILFSNAICDYIIREEFATFCVTRSLRSAIAIRLEKDVNL